MTHPMPEPLKHDHHAQPHMRLAAGLCALCRSFTTERGLEKRLTDAECADEWEAAEQGASWAVLHHALGDKRVTAWQVERFDNAARTWHRFATTPHALEATPRPPSLNDNPFEADIKEIRA